MDNVSEQAVAGVLTPLFALRSENDFGCGDTGALRGFIEWAAAHGFRCVQLLPVNETGADHSPYNAISSVAIEPTTIDLTALPDLLPSEIAEHNESISAGPVRWRVVKATKRKLLLRAFANFTERHWEANDTRARQFAAFVKAESAWLDAYSLFRVLAERHGSEQWDEWAPEVCTFSAARKWLASQRNGSEIAQEIRFVQYVQWIAFTQWREARQFASERGVMLMGDVPFGVNFYSADVWAQPELFDLDWSGGAPPEPAFADDEFTRRWGQNWGVPLYRWPAHRASGFAWWRQRVRKIEEAFHLFRIDHVLGFYRIYGFPWRPQRNAEFATLTIEEALARTGGELPHYIEHADDSPEHCAANCAQGEEFLRVLQSEVGPTALVGEDLGTVPHYVRPSLLSLGIPGFKVPQWEKEPDSRLTPGSDYTPCSIATYATHDHEPLRAMWTRWMSIIAAALEEPERLAAKRDNAWHDARRLAAWGGFEVPHIMDFDEVHERLIAALFRSRSRFAIVMITDLLGTDQRFNVPGTVAADNWSARLPEDWAAIYAGKIQRISALVAASGR